MIEYNAAKRPSGLRACADGLDSNPDKDFAQKCMRYAADKMEELGQQRDRLAEESERYRLEANAMMMQRDRLAEAVERYIAEDYTLIALQRTLAAVKGGQP